LLHPLPSNLLPTDVTDGDETGGAWSI